MKIDDLEGVLENEDPSVDPLAQASSSDALGAVTKIITSTARHLDRE